MLGNHGLFEALRVLHQPVEHLELLDREGDLEQAFVAVELCLALVLVYIVGKQLVEVEVWTLNDD